MSFKKGLAHLFKPVVAIVAAIYFIIDAIVLAIFRPLLRRIGGLKIFQLVAAWIATLGPYQTLAIFLIPVLILEPIKPLSAVIMASGHVVVGVMALVLAEVLKVVIVERIFHIARPKLMTIRSFAWTFDFVAGWLAWAKALPPWQTVQRSFDRLKVWVRVLQRRARPRKQSPSTVARPAPVRANDGTPLAP
jgi:hypothetical protein